MTTLMRGTVGVALLACGALSACSAYGVWHCTVVFFMTEYLRPYHPIVTTAQKTIGSTIPLGCLRVLLFDLCMGGHGFKTSCCGSTP